MPIAFAPPIVALVAFSVLIDFWSESFTRFRDLYRFLSVYNAFSDYWAIAAAHAFWGSGPRCDGPSLVRSWCGIVCSRTTGFGTRLIATFSTAICRWRSLAAFISLYYLGRSVDNVFCCSTSVEDCLVIPPYVNAAASLWRCRDPRPGPALG